MTGSEPMDGSGVRITIGASLATALSAIPPFLLGSLLPAIRTELDIDTGSLGALVSVYFFAGALSAVPGGRLAEKLGGRGGLMFTGSVTSASLILIALVVETEVQLGAAMIIAGGANGMVHPAGNLAIVRGVARRFQGISFGTKQAAAPLATLFAGLALPTVGLTLGWQAAFLAATVLFPIVVLTMPRESDSENSRYERTPIPLSRPLIMIAGASALAFGAATTIGAFLVDSVTSSGGSAVSAGTTLTVASAAAISVRLIIGWQTDRRTSPSITLVAALMAIGAVGFLLLALAPGWGAALGAIIGMAAGWGWPGLLYHAISHSHPDAPASATAVATTGNALGAAVGPLTFGLIAGGFSFTFAWSVSGLELLLAAALMLLASRSASARPTAR